MDFLKTQLDRIQKQIAGLNASQKMLTGTLVAIMVVAMFWWARYAGEPEMMPLLDMPLAAEDLARIPDHLRAKGISATVIGDKVYVPAEQHRHALADLTYARMLPKNTSAAFDRILGQMTIFDSPSKQQALWNEAKQAKLSEIISALEGVADATVIIDGSTRRGINRAQEPRAMINITMRPGYKATQHLVNAAADLVAGAQHGLKTSEIRVVIDSRPYRPYDNESEYAFMGEGQFDALVKREQYYAAKIQDALQYIPGAIVSVHCRINNKVVHETQHLVDKESVVQAELRTTTETEEIASTEPLATEPGAVPNTGMQIDEPVAIGPTHTQSRESTQTEFLVDHSRTERQVRDPGGDVTVLGASVRLPRSHFVTMYKARFGTDSEPDQAALDALMNEELEHIRHAVRTVTQIQQDDNISVALFTDVLPQLNDQPAVASSSLPLGMQGHGKEIAIGLLAVISLFMVLMMVRRAAPTPVVPAAPEPKQTPQLAAGEDLVGEVGEVNPMLDGMELDEDAVRAQQMIGQVSTLVKENPDAAAQLVKRWLNRA